MRPTVLCALYAPLSSIAVSVGTLADAVTGAFVGAPLTHVSLDQVTTRRRR